MSTGYIVGVFLVYIGLTPDASTLACSFSIFYTSSIPAIQFFIGGGLDYRYSIWITGISVIGSAFGSLVVRKYIISKKLLYMLLLLIEVVILSSLIIITGIYSYNLQQSIESDKFIIGFRHLC